MSGSQIVRLRGDALDLVWSADMQRLIQRCAELGAHSSRALRAAWRAAANAFAVAQGWDEARAGFKADWLPRDRSSRRWTRDVRAVDHPETLYCAGRAVALVVHLNGTIRLDLLPPEIVVDALPASWFLAGRTRAFVLRSATDPAAVDRATAGTSPLAKPDEDA